jgi:catechol 2,3-dioxygenase-like lactoylglutathione lyase family enzyme
VSLQHVSLETRPADVEAEVRFWALLGFEQVPAAGTLAERATWVQAGTTQIHLLYADEPVVPPEGHAAVICADYAETLDALSKAGFEVDERTQHWGVPRCYTRSPGGHRVEVMAAPPTR